MFNTAIPRISDFATSSSHDCQNKIVNCRPNRSKKNDFIAWRSDAVFPSLGITDNEAGLTTFQLKPTFVAVVFVLVGLHRQANAWFPAPGRYRSAKPVALRPCRFRDAHQSICNAGHRDHVLPRRTLGMLADLRRA